MKKTVQVIESRKLALTPTQAAVIIALKRGNQLTAIRFAISLADLTREQAETLVDNVNSEYDDVYSYGSVRTDREITQAEFDLIHFICTRPEPAKVAAIKFIRAQYGWGLKESKDLVDTIAASPF